MSLQDIHNPLATAVLGISHVWPAGPKEASQVVQSDMIRGTYNYVDAFSVLCALSPGCATAAAVIEHRERDSRLHICTRPSAPPQLRSMMLECLSHVKELRFKALSPPAADSTVGQRSDTAEAHDLLTTIYGTCWEKYLDHIKEEGLELLEDMGSDPGTENIELLITSLKIVLRTDRTPDTGETDEDLLELHNAAKVLASNAEVLTKYGCSTQLASRLQSLPDAAEELLKFSSSQEKLPSDVVWVVPCDPQPESVSADIKTITRLLQSSNLPDIPDNFPDIANAARLPLQQSQTTPHNSPLTFTTHCASFLLQYVSQNGLVIDPYIGCPWGTCYCCIMLIDVYNKSQPQNMRPYAISRFSCDFDSAWGYPSLGSEINENLKGKFLKTLTKLSKYRAAQRNKNKPIGGIFADKVSAETAVISIVEAY
ncbi:hypothetical protein DICSQDRAFT_183282 [Dichomitus squalens LYAD-421 SS1]|uniref:Uncharacterized protein n=1 Tax=Dichomitus squalens (strain LYAD-421) TaxID=732165 RepID=R7SNM6_DICSQ|nr:uncharacterized protein DICSQDRAFT_183282 [Dichomitus squalens LYAD-421 SS1]EJF57330.1 hypothetical protein DICSQDRAFT_183282 [Dichomitus squalens LYAD-421 SS1]